MNRTRIFIAVGVFVTLLVILIGVAACSGGDRKAPPPQEEEKGEITLTYWRVFDDKTAFDPLIEEFQRDHPNVKIDYKKLTYAEYERTLLESLAAGRGPDLFSIGNYWVPKYRDKLATLPEDVMSVADYEKTFFPVAAQDNVIDNQIYGIPYSIDTLALFYNRDILTDAGTSEAPVTWDDVVGRPPDPTKPNDAGVASKLSAINKRQGNLFVPSAFALGNKNVARSQDILSLIMLQRRVNMVNAEKDRATFNLSQNVGGQETHLGTEALAFYTSFAKPDSPNYSWNAEMGDSVKAFAEGRAAMMIGYAYNIPNIERSNPNLRYNVAPVPQIAGTDPVNFANYWTEVVSKDSPNQKEAWEFIRFISSRDVLRDYNEKTNTVSSRRDVGTSGKFDVFYKQNESAVSWYKGIYDKADTIFLDLIDAVLRGEDPQRAIDSAALKETEVLKELKGQS